METSLDHNESGPTSGLPIRRSQRSQVPRPPAELAEASAMKRALFFPVIGFLVLISISALADAPIYQGLLWDSSPAVAYNSKDREFLVAWNVFNPLFPPTDTRFFGPVMGQLIKEGGERVGAPFRIFDAGVVPEVAYNAQQNEYLVVAEQWWETVGQRVSALGLIIGGRTTLIANARYPKVLYNSKSGNYLAAGARLIETSPGSGLCDIEVYTVRVGANGQALGAPVQVADEYHGLCSDGAVYSLAYAPIQNAKTPQGRYLLAIGDPTDLRMLGSDGRILPTLYNPQSGSWYGSIPFQQSKVGHPYNIDAAFGYLGGDPVFLLVWGDIDQDVDGYGEWTGIWGGVVNAEQDYYETTWGVSNDVFPISWQWSHWATSGYAKQWKPAVVYNTLANRFVVAWRETPGTDPNDLTNVNHIRANTVDSTLIPPQQNLVLSATGGSENPKLPCIASSTTSSKCLIAWEDYRNLLGDIYGTFLVASTRLTSAIKPQSASKVRVYWKSAEAGHYHTLGIRSDGSLWAWGSNISSQLGLGNTQSRHSPARVGSDSDWVTACAGGYHSLGIRSDGSLWSWGENYHGQLGQGVGDTQYRHIPTRVGSDSNWDMISAGRYHSLGIRLNGALWAWGINGTAHVLGLGDTNDRHIPTQVGPGSDWAVASAGGYHGLGIQTGTPSSRSLWAWGHNYNGQLGLGVIGGGETPTFVGPYSDWVMVSAGYAHSLGIRSNGSLWAWGYNNYGQLGLGYGQDKDAPTLVPPYSNWVMVSAGGAHSLGIRSDGSLWSWGHNYHGQLGLGDTQDRNVPTQVGSASDWVMVSGGGYHSLGVRSDGSLWAWGFNGNGQLGMGDTQDRYEPTLVRFPWGVIPSMLLLLLK